MKRDIYKTLATQYARIQEEYSDLKEAPMPVTAPSKPSTKPAPTTTPSKPGTPRPHPLQPTQPGISPNPKAENKGDSNSDVAKFNAKRTHFKK